jgi:hypothetical protein
MRSGFIGQFAVRTEGGLDIHMTEHAAIRVGGGWTFLGGGVCCMNQIGLNAGFAYLFGR